jgi:hypothetical protein
MLIFYQEDMFPFTLQKLNEQGTSQLVIFWTSLVRKNSMEYSFKYFIDQFIYPSTCLLSNSTKPKVSEEIHKVLHLTEQAKISDWYLYHNYTENKGVWM